MGCHYLPLVGWHITIPSLWRRQKVESSDQNLLLCRFLLWNLLVPRAQWNIMVIPKFHLSWVGSAMSPVLGCMKKCGNSSHVGNFKVTLCLWVLHIHINVNWELFSWVSLARLQQRRNMPQTPLLALPLHQYQLEHIFCSLHETDQSIGPFVI